MMLPLPSTLSIHIFPPFLSTKSRQRISPNPELGSPSIPFRFELGSARKRFFAICLFIPIPLSCMETSTSWPSFWLALMLIFPFFGVNLMALDKRFRITESINGQGLRNSNLYIDLFAGYCKLCQCKVPGNFGQNKKLLRVKFN